MGDAWKENDGVKISQSCFHVAPVCVSMPSGTQMGGADRRNLATVLLSAYLELNISALDTLSISMRWPQKATVIGRVCTHRLKWTSKTSVSPKACLIS